MQAIKNIRLSYLILALLSLSVCSSSVIADDLNSDVVYQLHLPEGTGPFPAVVAMHGCSGLIGAVKEGLTDWAVFFKQHGYATLLVDSFTRRNLSGGAVCSSISLLQQAWDYRNKDAFNAYDYLAARSDISEYIFILGQSNGASVALLSATSEGQRLARSQHAFSGAIALYPWCGHMLNKNMQMLSPALILIGEKDDWTPASSCRQLQGQRRHQGIQLKVYADAYHSFDLNIPMQSYKGHWLGRNQAAFESSRQDSLNFLESLIKQ